MHILCGIVEISSCRSNSKKSYTSHPTPPPIIQKANEHNTIQTKSAVLVKEILKTQQQVTVCYCGD